MVTPVLGLDEVRHLLRGVTNECEEPTGNRPSTAKAAAAAAANQVIDEYVWFWGAFCV